MRDNTPSNLAANAAAVLAATVASRLTLPLGTAGTDESGTTFAGIITTPVPVLAAPTDVLRSLFHKTSQDPSVITATLTEVARRARTYEAYLEDLARTADADEDIVALALAGPRNRITKLTKTLALLGA